MVSNLVHTFVVIVSGWTDLLCKVVGQRSMSQHHRKYFFHFLYIFLYPVTSWVGHRPLLSQYFFPFIHLFVHKFGMVMYLNDLTLPKIYAYRYCCHFLGSYIHPSVCRLEFGHCGQIAWKKWPIIWHGHASRWFTRSCHWHFRVLLSVSLFIQPFGFEFVGLGLWL